MFVVAVTLTTMLSERRGVGPRRSSQGKGTGWQEGDMSQKPKEERVPRKESPAATDTVGRSSLIRIKK